MRIRMNRWAAPALVLSIAVTATGCSEILDVTNPNNMVEEELSNPQGARSIVNGASATVMRGIGAMLGPYATATDEVIWIGSRDAWRELDLGNVADPRNEFTDDAFRFFAQGRWMADEAVRRVEDFNTAGTLADRTQLARAYLYAAIAYITIGDMFEDFALSDKRTAAAPIGPANMASNYDRAIDYLTKALPLAGTNATLIRDIRATRARAHHAKAIWARVKPQPNVAQPLAASAEAVADAQAVLAANLGDWRFVLTLATDDIALAGEASLAYSVNQRRELQLGPTYVRLSANLREIQGTALNDPITAQPAPAVTAERLRFVAGVTYQPVTIASAREMHLIIAESALAGGNTAGFTTAINALRALDELPAYTGQIPALDMLKHSRQANLYLQGRRLADLYRFGDRSPNWLTNSNAVQAPGTLFPITCIEIRANEHLSGSC